MIHVSADFSSVMNAFSLSFCWHSSTDKYIFTNTTPPRLVMCNFAVYSGLLFGPKLHFFVNAYAFL